MVDGSPQLCFVKSLGCALELFFTEAELTRQWGDDWNDAPFEHNAGEPYDDWTDENGIRRKATITRLITQGPWQIVGEGLVNSPYTVEQINAGMAAWLLPNPIDFEPYCRMPVPEPIWAGTTLDDVVARIQASGGIVYLDMNALTAVGA